MQCFEVILFFNVRTRQQNKVKPTYLCPLDARKLAGGKGHETEGAGEASRGRYGQRWGWRWGVRGVKRKNTAHWTVFRHGSFPFIILLDALEGSRRLELNATGRT